MKEYEKEYSLYTSKLDKCVASYYEEYADKRKKLESEEQAEIAYKLQCAQNQYNIIQERVSLLHNEINENTILSEKMKKKKSVDTLIEYFQDQRADSIKEAVNLYFEEEHRRRLEEFAQEQVRLTAEAAEQARQAAESAEEAAASADEAISRVDSALERANEAYEKAEEAYSEAQNAYYAATTNND
ncbi:MAG TPA: hypothetical protein DHV79_00365 [Lachnospiraceae bacterium]|nr:hypothetical protein [Lachnospiraceae bacterium]